MNPMLKARQDELQAALHEAQNLGADASDDAMKAASERLTKAQQAHEAALSLSAQASDSDIYLNAARATSIAAVPDPNHDKIVKAKGTFEEAEQVGVEVFGRTREGKLIAHTSEGWGLSERQFKAISEPSYYQAFDRMLRGKADRHDYQATLTEGLDTGGGFLAPPEFMTEVVMRKPHPTSVLNYIRNLPCSRDRVVFPAVRYTTDDTYSSGVRIQWIGEGGPTPAITDPSFGDVEIPIFTGQFPLEVSRNLLEDAAIPVQDLIQHLASQAYQLGMDNIVVNGTGVGQPAGLLQSPGSTNEPPTANIGNAVTADGLTGLVYGLPPQYQDNAVSLMNFIDAFKTFALIKDTANHYIFGLQSTFDGGLATARQPVMFGKPVIFSAFMPNGAGGANVIVYGDLRETYTLAQRIGLTVMPYGDQDKSMLAANKIGWMFRFRAGGDVVQSRAAHVGVQT